MVFLLPSKMSMALHWLLLLLHYPDSHSILLLILNYYSLEDLLVSNTLMVECTALAPVHRSS
jgi:hypothetical protein